MELAQFILLLCIICKHGSEAARMLQSTPVLAITRINNGDVFTADGGECTADTCVGLSSGTAVSSTLEDLIAPKGSCSCQCHQHLPAFREDLHICVDDIHECILAPFVSGSTSQKIPFVFLPLKGQIIHPSKEISFTGVKTPLCVVSGAQFLTEGGWKDLKDPLDADVPFRLYRDEGRTFLQWVGESELRKQMSGRLVLVHLLCRELADNEPSKQDSVFKPCVAFRVVGTPVKYLHNVSEVTFSADAHVTEDDGGEGLSISEYVAIGISSILLGMIYVASVFLYLHIRKRKNNYNKTNKRHDKQSLNAVEEGIVKSNPLLGMSRHFSGVDNNFSESSSSENDNHSDSLQNHDDKRRNFHLTSAMVHPQQIYYEAYSCKSLSDSSTYDSPSNERLPEENVAIVETMEGRDDKPDTMRAITGTTRRKLYFNPAYFEPELLLAPPPAALEFLLKIREVITIAKQKMSCKRYVPSLIEIPEDDNDNSVYDQVMIGRRDSVVSLKRDNSRRQICSGCNGCSTKDLVNLYGKLPEFPSVKTCKNCSLPVNDSKQRSIQKWLENVPILKNNGDPSSGEVHQAVKLRKHLRSPTRSLSPEYMSSFRTPSPRPASERARSPISSSSLCGSKVSTRSQPAPKPRKVAVREKTPSARRKVPVKPKAPPPPLPVDYNIKKEQKLPPPDMINEAIIVEKESDKLNMPTMRKNMKAVINEFAVQHGLGKSSDTSSSPEMMSKRQINYESDSLERSRLSKGFCTPTECTEASSSQPSPSLSSALPMTEEHTFTNAILDNGMVIDSENLQIPGLEDYEIIVVKKEETPRLIESSLYKLPQLLQRSNGYSLVSEVYVNNGYNFGSVPSSPCESNCSTLAKSKSHSNYEQVDVTPGPLTIEVEDCPDNYIRVDDSDNFEPDTLDRKPGKTTLSRFICTNKTDEYIDSLERPNTKANFVTETTNLVDNNNLENHFTRKFGSLREIYEFKTKNNLRGSSENLTSFNCVQPKNEVTTWKYPTENEYEGRLLTLEERHSRRQRCTTKPSSAVVPPDVIPPPPHNNSSIYEHPKPPRKVIKEEAKKPPLPPKNGSNRSTSQKSNLEHRASPTSEKSCTASSCLSGASVSPYSSDYESCLIGEQTYKKQSDVKGMKESIDSDEVKFKNAVNNRFTEQRSPKQNEKKVVSKKITEDVNNNYYSSDNEKSVKDIKKAWLKMINQSSNYYKVAVDSGYLSTDSSESQKKKVDEKEVSVGGSETDESLGDGHSESGAESIETHSVFFGVYNNKPFVLDNGREQKNIEGFNGEEYASTDSETVSYTTVVPVSSVRSSKNTILRNPVF